MSILRSRWHRIKLFKSIQGICKRSTCRFENTIVWERWHFWRSEINIDYCLIQCIRGFCSSPLPIFKLCIQVPWIDSKPFINVNKKKKNLLKWTGKPICQSMENMNTDTVQSRQWSIVYKLDMKKKLTIFHKVISLIKSCPSEWTQITHEIKYFNAILQWYVKIQLGCLTDTNENVL